MERFRGNFSAWDDVVREFALSGLDAVEPDEVIYAHYDRDGYEGSAEVLIRRGDVYYWGAGSHCSCYGLEGQWKPIDYELEVLLRALERQSSQYSSYYQTIDWKPAIKYLQELVDLKSGAV